jgi:hypothetical protein
MGIGAQVKQENHPNFFECLFQQHSDFNHVTQIASDEQFKQIEKMIDQYYNVQLPQRGSRKGLVVISKYYHLNTQKNKDIVKNRIKEMIKRNLDHQLRACKQCSDGQCA